MSNAEETAVAALLGMKPPCVSSQNDKDQAQKRKGPPKKRKLDLQNNAAAIKASKSSTGAAAAKTKQAVTGKPTKKRRKKKVVVVEYTFPVPPRVIQVCKVPKTHVDHSYRDMSSVPIEAGYIVERDVAKMTFAQKLHHMLSRDDLSDCINWNQHGRAFRIIVPRRLEERSLLSLYFGHNRYSTFLTQLQNYGFKQITRGKDRGSFYNEFFLRGLPHLCRYMPAHREGRKLIATPTIEPDLSTISMLWPVPMKEEIQKPLGFDKNLVASLIQQQLGTGEKLASLNVTPVPAASLNLESLLHLQTKPASNPALNNQVAALSTSQQPRVASAPQAKNNWQSFNNQLAAIMGAQQSTQPQQQPNVPNLLQAKNAMQDSNNTMASLLISQLQSMQQQAKDPPSSTTTNSISPSFVGAQAQNKPKVQHQQTNSTLPAKTNPGTSNFNLIASILQAQTRGAIAPSPSAPVPPAITDNQLASILQAGVVPSSTQPPNVAELLMRQLPVAKQAPYQADQTTVVLENLKKVQSQVESCMAELISLQQSGEHSQQPDPAPPRAIAPKPSQNVEATSHSVVGQGVTTDLINALLKQGSLNKRS